VKRRVCHNFHKRQFTDQLTQEFARQNPVESFIEETAGGITTPLIAGKFIKPLETFAKMNPKLAASIFGGLGMGTALAGEAPFGTSISERLQALGAGTAGGAILGPLGLIGGELLTKKAIPSVINSVRELFSTPEKAATDIVRPFMQDAFPEGIDAATARLSELGTQANIMDVGEAPVRALAKALTERDLGFKNILTKTLPKRTREGFRRIDRSIRNALGTNGKEVAKTTTEINEKRFLESAPLYAQADNMTVNQTQVADFVTDLDAQLADMQNVDIAKGLSKLRKGLFNDLPDGSKEIKTTVRQLITVRDDLSKRISRAWETGSKQGNLKEWRLLTNWRNGFDESLMPSQFLQANKIFSSSKDVNDAMTAGSKMLRVDAEDLTELMATYNSSQREAYLIGATKAIKQKMGSLADGGKVSKVFNNPNVRERLGLIIGDENKTVQFLNDVETENVFKATENIVLGNSATSANLRAQQIFDERTPISSVAELTGKLIKSFQSVKVPQQVKAEVGGMLTKQGLTPETLQAIMKTPLANKTIEMLLNFQPGVGTLTAPGILGSKIPGIENLLAPGLLGTQTGQEGRQP